MDESLPSDPSPSSHPLLVMNPNISSTSHPVPVMNLKPSSTASSEDDRSVSKQQGPQLEPPLKPKAFDPPRSGSKKGQQLILRTEESESESESESEPETEKKRKRKRKRKRSKAPAPASEEKQLKEKSPFRRIWSSDDELTILQGMAEFLSGEDPSAIDMVAFHKFIRPSLKLKEVSLKQLRDKIHKLRVQYEAAAMRNITNPHEQKAYELYKRIWKKKKKKKKEDNSGNGATVDNNAPAAAASAAEDKISYPLLKEALNQMQKSDLHMLVTREGDVLESLDDAKKAMMENKLKRMRLDGIKSYIRKMDFNKELAKTIFDSLCGPDGS